MHQTSLIVIHSNWAPYLQVFQKSCNKTKGRMRLMILTHCSCWWICVNIRIHHCSSRTLDWKGWLKDSEVWRHQTQTWLQKTHVQLSEGMLTHQNVKYKLSLQEQLLSCCWFSSTIKCSDLIIQTCFPIWFLYKKEKRNKKNDFLKQIASVIHHIWKVEIWKFLEIHSILHYFLELFFVDKSNFLQYFAFLTDLFLCN